MTKSRDWRFSAAVFLVSAVTIIAEIAIMRELALRFWSHLAWLVVSIALLGFGASGTMLILIRRLHKTSCGNLLFLCLTGCALSLTISLRLGDSIDVDLIQMAWQWTNLWSLLFLELSIALPFLFGGLCIAVILEDMPSRAGRNYAASFLGSGVGGLLTPWLLYMLTGRELICAGSIILMMTALLFILQFRQLLAWLCLTALLIFSIGNLPEHPAASEDKAIPQIMAMQGSTRLFQESGPQGMVEVVNSPAYHGGPGTSLLSTAPVPPQNIIGLDGHFAGLLYEAGTRQDFQFMDHATSALPFHLLQHDNILIMEPAGNGTVGLALFHDIARIETISANRDIAELLRNYFAQKSNIVGDTHLQLRFATARQTLRKAEAENPYSLIVLPATGDDFAGLTATDPDLVLTTETIGLGLEKLRGNGLLAVTTEAHLPPRESLRLVNLMVEVLQQRGLVPATRLIVIRNWATVTLIVSRTPFSEQQYATTRQFCSSNGFDLVWLADVQESELNRYHNVGGETPVYHSGVKQLLSTNRHEFASSYFYNLFPPDNNRPFFHNFQDTFSIDRSGVQYGGNSPSFQEIGTLLLWVTLFQTAGLAFILIAAPLIPAIGITRQETGKMPALIFFASIGLGFMLLELGMMQLFTSYLAHPVWASSTVLSAFLLFAGIGSSITALFTAHLQRIHLAIIAGVLLVIVLQTATIDLLLDTTDHYDFVFRIILVYLYLAPLAVLLGMVFPLGIRRLGHAHSRLIPWAWCVNGCASVTGSLAAPILAMQWGFDQLLWTALGCYFLGGVCCWKLGFQVGKVGLKEEYQK